MGKDVRPQVTTYLHADTKVWLKEYARQNHFKESELVRILIEREQQIQWFSWALRANDPARKRAAPMPARQDCLPPRWNDPPKKRPGRKRKK